MNHFCHVRVNGQTVIRCRRCGGQTALLPAEDALSTETLSCFACGQTEEIGAPSPLMTTLTSARGGYRAKAGVGR